MIIITDRTNLKRLIKLYKENSQISVRKALQQSIADRIVICPDYKMSIYDAINYLDQKL